MNVKKWVACGLLSLTFGSAVFWMARTMPSCLYRQNHMDYYFGSDIPRVYDNMTDPRSDQYRSHAHPLFPALLTTSTFLIHRALGVNVTTAMQLLIAANAIIWTALMFLLLHLVTGRLFDSVILTLFTSSSAAVVFWLATPESFCFGSTTLLIPFLVFLVPRGGGKYLTHVLIGLASVSIVITNWMSGIAASWIKLGWRRAILISLYVLVALTLLWGAEKVVYRSTRFFLGPGAKHEMKYLNDQGVARTAEIFFLYSFLPPSVGFAPSTRRDRVGYAGTREWCDGDRYERMVTTAGWGLWSVMLLLGIGHLLRWDSLRLDPLRRMVLLVLAGQFVLHLIYSKETFMLVLQWFPLLVLMVAFACQHPASRRIVLICAILAIPLAGIRNLQLRDQALAFCQRADILREEQRRNQPALPQPQPAQKPLTL